METLLSHFHVAGLNVQGHMTSSLEVKMPQYVTEKEVEYF